MSSLSGRSGYIIVLNAHDVLLGKGDLTEGNEGNLRFGQLIQEKAPKYAAAREKHVKGKIACDIIRKIAERGGRFLRKVESPVVAERLGIPTGTNAWVVVDDSIVLKTLKQAFRDKESATNFEDLLNRSSVGMPPVDMPFSTQRERPTPHTLAEQDIWQFNSLAGNLGRLPPIPSQPIGTSDELLRAAVGAELQRLRFQQALASLQQQRQQQQQQEQQQARAALQQQQQQRQQLAALMVDSDVTSLDSPSFLQVNTAQPYFTGNDVLAGRRASRRANMIAALRADCKRRTELQDAIALEGRRLGLSPISAIRRSVELVPGPFSTMLDLPTSPENRVLQGPSGSLNLQPRGLDQNVLGLGQVGYTLGQSLPEVHIASSPRIQALLTAASMRMDTSRASLPMAISASPAASRKRKSSYSPGELHHSP
jgi:hypothetical protein